TPRRSAARGRLLPHPACRARGRSRLYQQHPRWAGPGAGRAAGVLRGRVPRRLRRSPARDGPLEFRMKNLIVEGEETVGGHLYHGLRGKETLEAAVEGSGYGSPRPPNVG